MEEYCDVDICSNLIPCYLHSRILDTFTNEIAKIRYTWILQYLPKVISIDCGSIIFDYYGFGDFNMRMGHLCKSKLFNLIWCNKIGSHISNITVQKFDGYIRQMDKLITELIYFFRTPIADIIAEYTGVRHEQSMKYFISARSELWMNVHRNISAFHNVYFENEMQKYMDSRSEWHRVIKIYNTYFHGKYAPAYLFTKDTMSSVFDLIIMISLTNPLSNDKDMGKFDFLDYFYQLTLLILPIEENDN